MLETMIGTLISQSAPELPGGQRVFEGSLTVNQEIRYVVPDGVTSICAVAVGCGGSGGGGLSYRNDIPVMSGETLTIRIDARHGAFAGILRNGTFLCVARNGYKEGSGGPGGKALGDINDGGGSGGRAYVDAYGDTTAGGGAGGYTGKGGDGGSDYNVLGGNGQGGGGAGGTGVRTGNSVNSRNGGGVGLNGIGSNGVAAQNSDGTAGSNGKGVKYGGGSGYPRYSIAGFLPGVGAVRIIWGKGRSFPNNAADV